MKLTTEQIDNEMINIESEITKIRYKIKHTQDEIYKEELKQKQLRYKELRTELKSRGICVA
jgi:predicted  nucleic acid-binding Zn-ribbon protein